MAMTRFSCRRFQLSAIAHAAHRILAWLQALAECRVLLEEKASFVDSLWACQVEGRGQGRVVDYQESFFRGDGVEALLSDHVGPASEDVQVQAQVGIVILLEDMVHGSPARQGFQEWLIVLDCGHRFGVSLPGLRTHGLTDLAHLATEVLLAALGGGPAFRDLLSRLLGRRANGWAVLEGAPAGRLDMARRDRCHRRSISHGFRGGRRKSLRFANPSNESLRKINI